MKGSVLQLCEGGIVTGNSPAGMLVPSTGRNKTKQQQHTHKIPSTGVIEGVHLPLSRQDGKAHHSPQEAGANILKYWWRSPFSRTFQRAGELLFKCTNTAEGSPHVPGEGSPLQLWSCPRRRKTVNEETTLALRKGKLQRLSKF